MLAAVPAGSPLRGPTGALTAADAPLMQAIVAFIFLFFVVPGVAYGYVARSVTSHRDIVQGMAEAMSTMGYYLVMAFFASLFIAAFGKSNLGALLALKGASGLQALGLPVAVTLVGIVGLSGFVDLFIGSASAKWALLAPILVPMLMTAGPLARADPGRLPHRRLHHQHHHPADAVFPAGGGLLPALGEVHRHRHAGVADVALLAGVPGRLDRAAAGLVGRGPAAGAVNAVETGR